MLHRHGAFWAKVDGNNADTWRALVDDRYGAITWPFGKFHQAKVFADDVGIGLALSATRDEAMGRGLAWIQTYKQTGPAAVDAVMGQLFERWRSLFRTRLNVLDRLFCGLGGGYEWLDGALIDTSPDAWQEERNRPDFFADVRSLLTEIPAEVKAELIAKNPAIQDFLDPKPLTLGPEPDDGQPYSFRQISLQYSNLARVPDNVRQDWLEAAYETATALRDRAGSSIEEHLAEHTRTRALGAQFVAELDRRFTERLPKGKEA